MTVSDWGSTGAPHMAPGYGQPHSKKIHAQYIHPAHGGADPATAARMHDQVSDPAGFGGYAAAVAPASAPARETGHAAPPAQGGPNFGGDQAPPAEQPSAAGVLNIIGAVMSVVLVVGLGVWGYQLAVRDVREVPVVRALEGPMRIQPEEPGGAVAPHQGLAVNDVAADGESAGPVDQVVLAPPVTELALDDEPVVTDVTDPGPEVSASPQRPALAPMPSSGGEIDADAAVAEALGLSEIPGLDIPASAAPSEPLELIPESVPGVSRSPRPMPRPSGYQDLPQITAPLRAVDVSASASTPPPARPVQASAPVPQSAPDVALGQEVDPSTIDAGTRLVQLGAHDSAEAARAQWKEIAGQNPDMFQNRNWTIERSEAGGKTFFRLRAIGFDGLSEARSFCAALVAGQGSCIPVID